jgi:hypothetical protein
VAPPPKERGFDRPRHRLLCVPSDDITTALGALERGKAKESQLVVTKRVRLGRYVVSTGARGRPILLLPTSANVDLDVETEGGAVWEVQRWFAPRRDGKVVVTFVRTSPRHGRATTYQHHKCRCERCRDANNALQQAYRSKGRPEPSQREFKHGAACAKRGCHCEIGRAAARERQRRSRAKRRAAAA